jgi:hypothetical protein
MYPAGSGTINFEPFHATSYPHQFNKVGAEITNTIGMPTDVALQMLNNHSGLHNVLQNPGDDAKR